MAIRSSGEHPPISGSPRKGIDGSQTRHVAAAAQGRRRRVGGVGAGFDPALARRDDALRFYAQQSVEQAVQLHAAQFSTLQIYDEAREHLIILAQKNFRAPFLHHLSMMKPGDGSACGSCLEMGAPAAVEDVKSDPAFEPHREPALKAGFEAVQASPVPGRSDALIAVLSTYFSTPRRFSANELNEMAQYAARIGPVLEKRLAA